MSTLSSLKKAAEKAAKAKASSGNIEDFAIQGISTERELAVIDHILVHDLEFIRADGSIVEYSDEAGDNEGDNR